MDQWITVDRRIADRTSVAELLERYRREVTPTKRGAADENHRLKAMSQRPFARIRMSALTSSRLAVYRDERLKIVSGAPFNREFNVLSHAIDTARREWDIYLPANPCTLVRRPSQGRPRNRRLRGNEGERLLAGVPSGAKPVARAFCGTCHRNGDAARRDPRATLDKRRPREARGTSALDQKRRFAWHAAVEPRGSDLPRRSALYHPPSTTGRVFGELSADALKLSFKRALYRAGIGGLHLHDLRHEATSRFFEKGLNVMEVASVTGHKTLQMLKRYTHLSAGDLAARLGQGFLAGTQAIGYHLCQRFFAWETCGS